MCEALFSNTIPHTDTDPSAKSCQQLVVKTADLLPHTPSRTPTSRLRPGHTRRNTTNLPAFYTLVRFQYFFYVKIGFAIPSRTPIRTPLPKSFNNSWGKPNMRPLTPLQERPHHVLSQDKNNYHQSARVLHPSVHSIKKGVYILFATTIFLTHILTPLPNFDHNSWWKPKICRLTLLQERPHHVFAQATKEYHQSVSVLHSSAP